MITTNMNGGNNFFVTATDPAGEWLDPIWVDKGAFDPSLFFDDDGKVYYTRRDWGYLVHIDYYNLCSDLGFVKILHNTNQNYYQKDTQLNCMLELKDEQETCIFSKKIHSTICHHRD